MNLTTALAVPLVLLVAAVGRAQPVATPSDPAPSVQAAPDEVRGSLAIRGVQGTKGAAAVGECDVELDLYHRDRIVQRLNTRLDQNGVVIVQDLPAAMGVRPVVRVKYAGVVYQEAGPEITAAAPTAMMDVTVFETTPERPAWHIVMRHVMAAPTGAGLGVQETVVVENPSDRTWIGGEPNEQGRRPVVVLTLPAAAEGVRLDSGFHGWCCTALADRTLTVQMPLMPGRATFRFSYQVPVAEGRADLRIGAAAPIDQSVIFVPDDASRAEAVGFEFGGTGAAGGAQDRDAAGAPDRMRMFHGASLPAGSLAGVVLTGLVPALSSGPDAAEAVTAWPWLSAEIGAGVVLVALVGALVVRARRGRSRAAAEGGS